MTVRHDLQAPRAYRYSEIAFPPQVLQLTVDSAPSDSRLVDITFFAAASCKTVDTNGGSQLPVAASRQQIRFHFVA